MTAPEDILNFWLDEVGPKGWYEASDDLDETVRDRFLDAYHRACDGTNGLWLTYPSGTLAYIILMDQFPRNMFRGSPRMYATDAKAAEIARASLDAGDAEHLPDDVNQFLVLPLMHSESRADHDACVAWMDRIGTDENRKFARHHREIIEQFGRFPHRNAILGRETTAEERKFIADGGFTG